MKKSRATPRLAGFRIESRLGSGGAGDVYRATAVDSGQSLAIKISHPSDVLGEDDLAFRLEYQLHRSLRHPHILRAHGFGKVDAQRSYYTMDLVETAPLATIYRQGGLAVLGDVALRLCDALGYAHDQGLLHGDVKSSNILVPATDPMSVRLADFGHATPIGQENGAVTGTLATLPPERLFGWPGDARSDLYSLGVVLFETVAGRLPWSARNPRELVQQISDVGAPSIAPWVRADRRWASLIDDLLAADPALRPSSAAEVARRLGSLLGRKSSGRRRLGTTARAVSALKAIGRAEEMRVALDTLHDRSDTRTLLIVGPEQVGKTRFAEDLARAAELAGVEVLFADARPDDGSAFRLARRIREGGRTRDIVIECDLARSADPFLESETDLPPPVHQRESQLTRLAERMLQRDAGLERERLLVFDSLEVSDLDSLDLLERIQARLRGTRTTLAVVARSGEDATPHRLRDEPHREIVLHPLDAAEVREFVLTVLAGPGGMRPGLRALDQEQLAELVDRLLGETGGVPGRLETEIARLMRAGRLRRRDDGWSFDSAGLDRETSATSSRSLAVQALRSLTPRHRRFLRLAAIAGREFDVTFLSERDPPSVASVTDFAAEGIRRGILDRARGRESQLRFRNLEVARSLYEALTPEARAAGHAFLARSMGSQPNLHPARAEIAEHLARAGDIAGARAAFVAAAETAAASDAFREASHLFRRAWEHHGPDDRKRLPAFALTWVRSLFMNAHFDEAAEVAQALLENAQNVPGDSRPLHLSILRGSALAAGGDGAAAQREFRRTLRSPRIREHPDLHAWALTEYGKTEMERNRGASARRVLEQARTIAMTAKLKLATGRAELCLGIQAWRADDAAGALDWHQLAQMHLLEAEARDLLPAVWGNQAICRWFLLEPRRAAELHRRAAQEFLEQRRRAEASRSYQNLAHVLTELGRFVEADEALAVADDLNRSMRAPRQASFFEYHQARLALYRGRMEEAQTRIDRAIGLAEGIDDAMLAVGHGSLRGLIQLDAGQIEAARETARRCLSSAETLKYRWGIAKSHYVLGRAELALEKWTEGLDHLAEAARVASAAQQPVVLYRVDLARAAAFASRGREADAARILESAKTLQERSESPLWAGLLHLTAGRVAFHAGSSEAASSELARAYEIFAQLGAERMRAETLTLQSRTFAARENPAAANAAASHARSLFRSLGLDAPAELPGETVVKTRTDVGRVLEAATSIARSLATVQGIDAILERILDVAITHLGCERGVVALVDPETERLRVRCARNIDRESVSDGLEISWSAIRNASRGSEIVHTGDALAEPAFSSRESIRRARIRSLIAVPIRWGERVLGSLYLDHRGLTDLFGPEQREFARFIADVAALGIHNALELELREEQVRNLRGELAQDGLVLPRGFIAHSDAVRTALRTGFRAVRDRRTVLIAGPTGTGKDHLARVLHETSGRRGDFVDCALPSLSETLFEGELFGVARGAATTVSERKGLVEAAQGGTLFLNEIGDLALPLQPKLLQFLDHRKFRRVGSAESRVFDGLVICATNADLEQKVASGLFREDLFHRLAECVLEIPPLRERVDDIAPLAEHFLGEFAQRSGRTGAVFHPRAIELLRRASWEGNVRELRSTIVRALDLMGSERVLRPEHLHSPSLRSLRDTWDGHRVPFSDVVSQEEIRGVHDALTRCGGVVLRAANLLGITEGKLRRLIVKYGLEHLRLQSRGRPPAPAPSRRKRPSDSDTSNGHLRAPQPGRAKRTTPSA